MISLIEIIFQSTIFWSFLFVIFFKRVFRPRVCARRGRGSPQRRVAGPCFQFRRFPYRIYERISQSGTPNTRRVRHDDVLL